MEGIILLVLSASVGYLVNRMDKMETKLDRLENELIHISSILPKRKTDNFE